MSQTAQTPDGHQKHRDLTAFQQAILSILAEEGRYGLAIKKELESYYGKEVNHGRLYPNIDQLVDAGLVEKSELDKRTNMYELTHEGYKTILDHYEWKLSKFVINHDRAQDIYDLVDELKP